MVRAWRVVAFFAAVLVAVTCTSSTRAAGPAGYAVPLWRIVADANAQNYGSPAFRPAAPGTKVPMSPRAGVV